MVFCVFTVLRIFQLSRRCREQVRLHATPTLLAHPLNQSPGSYSHDSYVKVVSRGTHPGSFDTHTNHDLWKPVFHCQRRFTTFRLWNQTKVDAADWNVECRSWSRKINKGTVTECFNLLNLDENTAFCLEEIVGSFALFKWNERFLSARWNIFKGNNN